MWITKEDYDENGPLIVHRKVDASPGPNPKGTPRLARAPARLVPALGFNPHPPPPHSILHLPQCF